MKLDASLPIPPHFDPTRLDQVFRVPYQARAEEAMIWAREHGITPAARDGRRVGLLVIDAQNTFSIPGFELYVGGRSGTGAVDDHRRLCEFLYRNLGVITEILPTLDTHSPMQIFHPMFLVDGDGNHPPPMTAVTLADVEAGVWGVDPVVALALGEEPARLEEHLRHYTARLAASGKYALMIWPYHAMLGGIGHALVSSVEEAIFFHAQARSARTWFEMKGNNPLTENYSVLCPEVLEGADGRVIAHRNHGFIERLLGFDALIVAGQAKSHCVAWTVQDLLNEIQSRDASLARKVYLLTDCTSPVVVPGVVDFSNDAERAYARFAAAGMHLVRSTEPIASWPGIA